MANLKNDPNVVALIDKEVARAVKTTTAAAVRSAKAASAEIIEFHASAGSKDIVRALKLHSQAIVSSLKGVTTEAAE